MRSWDSCPACDNNHGAWDTCSACARSVAALGRGGAPFGRRYDALVLLKAPFGPWKAQLAEIEALPSAANGCPIS